MLQLSLRSRPAVVSDLKSCERWLERAPLGDPQQACFVLTTLLEELEETPPTDRNLLAILERVRRPIRAAAGEHSKRFSGRPLPLREHEAASFDEVHDLFAALGRGYRRLLNAAIDNGAPALANRMHLFAGRAIECVAAVALSHYRARRVMSPSVWQDLNELYQLAEEHSIEHEPIASSGGLASSCASVYLRAALLSVARPYGLSARQLEWTMGWLRQWVAKVDFGVVAEGDAMYAVDLIQDEPPRLMKVAGATETCRFLGLSKLRRFIAGRILKLENGEDLAELGLGAEGVQADLHLLLSHLLQSWTEAPAARQYTRRAVSERADVAIGLREIHAALGEAQAIQLRSMRSWELTREQADKLHALGVVPPAAPVEEAPIKHVERWELLEDSAGGFRLRNEAPGERVSQHQLMGLRPTGAKRLILAEIRWLQSTAEGAVTVGVQALPGLARAVWVRPVFVDSLIDEPFVAAFLLPASATNEASLVLQLGSFAAGRMFDLRVDERVARVRLDLLAQRAYDFERVTFTIVK